MTTSARMLQLLNLLQTHRFWPGSELADRLEVSQRTLRRDIERLRDLGYDVDASRGVAGGYQLRAGTSLPPLLLSEEEAVAVAVGLHAAATGAAPGLEDTVVQALTKLAALMPPRLRRRMEALSSQTDGLTPWAGPGTLDADVVTVLAQACRDQEAVTFDYTARDGETSRRRVEPHRLATLGRRWYLVGHDRDRHDWRTFRVDRIAVPAATGQRFRPRELPAADAVTYVRERLRSMPTRYTVRARLAAPAADVEAYMGRWGRVEADGDGCRMTLFTDTLDWPVMVLARFDCDVSVEEPAELRDLLHRVGRRFAEV